jgi:prepilin signal peptidase PulO-like enzyme (type II secretory pathway)
VGAAFSTLGFYLYVMSQGFTLSEGLFLGVVFFSLAGIFLTDLFYGIIPDQFVAAIVISVFIFLGIYEPSLFPWYLLSGIASLALFLALFLITRGRGMGFGDVKFAFAMGFFLGFPQIVIGLYSAFLTAACVSVILVLVGKKKLKGGTIVFGPFLVLGTIFAHLFGQQIINLLL